MVDGMEFPKRIYLMPDIMIEPPEKFTQEQGHDDSCKHGPNCCRIHDQKPEVLLEKAAKKIYNRKEN